VQRGGGPPKRLMDMTGNWRVELFTVDTGSGKSSTWVMAALPENNPQRDREAISFPQWRLALAKVAVSPAEKTALEREIISFLRLCKIRHVPASVMLIKGYIASREAQGPNRAREALRWFYRAARGEASVAHAAGGGGCRP
jgi:hypothetical protein